MCHGLGRRRYYIGRAYRSVCAFFCWLVCTLDFLCVRLFPCAHRSMQCPPVFGCSSGRNGINGQRARSLCSSSLHGQASAWGVGRRVLAVALSPRRHYVVCTTKREMVGFLCPHGSRNRCRRGDVGKLIDLFDGTKPERWN